MRKTQFANDELYHIFNRGIDKRNTFLDNKDISRFFQSMLEFNTIEPIGSIFENSFQRRLGSEASKSDKLVSFVCYCINPNHYHFLLRQLTDDGIKKFMHRIGTGFTKYFNNKYDRSGNLFQGPFKSIHVDSNEYLLYISAYINFNDRVHQLGSEASKLSISSWGEYMGNKNNGFCERDLILSQFKNLSEYKKFAEDSLKYILERKVEILGSEASKRG